MGRNPSDLIWHEVKLRFLKARQGAEESLRQILYSLGFDATALVTELGPRHGFLKAYCRSEKQATRLITQLSLLGLKHVGMTHRSLKTREWRDKWKEAIQPFHLTARFDVVPVWKMKEHSPGRRDPVYLDTTLSFGTGLHETTRFMAGLIETRAGKFETFLDIGTGTGLLSVIGSKCGAQILWAVDNDPLSIETARINLKRNGLMFDRCLCMDFRRFPSRRQFDFVAANVITDELIAMKNRIIAAVRPGKYLAVSGISLENFSRFRSEFESDLLKCLRVLKGKTWVAVLYRKCHKKEERRQKRENREL